MALEPDAVRRGSVVLVRLHGDKARPAVVVRSDLLARLSYATVLPITTELRDNVSLRIDVEAGPRTGLRVASQIMVDWPQTVRLDDLGEVIGRIDLTTLRAATRQLAILLGIGGPAAGRPRRTATSSTPQPRD